MLGVPRRSRRGEMSSIFGLGNGLKLFSFREKKTNAAYTSFKRDTVKDVQTPTQSRAFSFLLALQNYRLSPELGPTRTTDF